MAIVKVWIQLENKKWDLMPHNIDRMTGRKGSLPPTPVPTAADLAKTVTGRVWENLVITSPDATGAGFRISSSPKAMHAP